MRELLVDILVVCLVLAHFHDWFLDRMEGNLSRSQIFNKN